MIREALPESPWFEHFTVVDGALCWKKRRGKCLAGSNAGHMNMYGYMEVMFSRKHYKAHRIVYELYYGAIPEGMTIDHINGVKHDNRPENLRLATHAMNSRNQPMPVRNKTGIIGVFQDSRSGSFVATITLNNKSNRLGTFKTLEEARVVREAAAKANGFHENHGRPMEPRL